MQTTFVFKSCISIFVIYLQFGHLSRSVLLHTVALSYCTCIICITLTHLACCWVVDILGNPGVVHREGENSGPTQKSRAVSTTPGDIVLQSLFWASAGVLARDWAQISAIVFCALSTTKEFYRCDGATKPFSV